MAPKLSKFYLITLVVISALLAPPCPRYLKCAFYRVSIMKTCLLLTWNCQPIPKASKGWWYLSLASSLKNDFCSLNLDRALKSSKCLAKGVKSLEMPQWTSAKCNRWTHFSPWATFLLWGRSLSISVMCADFSHPGAHALNAPRFKKNEDKLTVLLKY